MKILICTHGSEQARRAVLLGASIAAPSEAKVILMGIQEKQRGNVAAGLRWAEATLTARGITPEVIEKSGDSIREIANWTRANHPDVVVIGGVRKRFGRTYALSYKADKLAQKLDAAVLMSIGEHEQVTRMVVCTGGKGYIEDSLDLLGEIARSCHARVTLLHVLPAPPAFYASLPHWQELTAGILTAKSALAEALHRQQQALTKMDVTAEIKIRQGSIFEEILREMREVNADLLVVGSTVSRNPFTSYVLGDVTRELLHRIDRPVLLVRSRVRKSARFFGLTKLFGRKRNQKAS